MRYTRKFLRARLALVASEIGWRTDEQVTTVTGGMRNLSSCRMNAKELMAWFDGVLCASRELRT